MGLLSRQALFRTKSKLFLSFNLLFSSKLFETVVPVVTFSSVACDQWCIMTCVCFSCNRGISWVTKDGVQHANYFGSLTQASTCRIGTFSREEIHVPFKSLLPMVFANLQCTACFNI